jgi:hypothetical protein
VILLRDVPHSVLRLQQAQHCQKFLDDPILLLSPYVAQSNSSPDTFAHCMKILDGAELQFFPEIINDLLLFTRELGHNRLIPILD